MANDLTVDAKWLWVDLAWRIHRENGKILADDALAAGPGNSIVNTIRLSVNFNNNKRGKRRNRKKEREEERKKKKKKEEERRKKRKKR